MLSVYSRHYQKPDELDRVFIAPFDETNFLWTSELFVARQPLDRISERPRRERSEFHRVIALDAHLVPELEAKRRIGTRFRYSPVQCEKFLGADEDPVQFEQGYWQTRLAQNCLRRKTQFFFAGSVLETSNRFVIACVTA
jgi:hypothetical protein